MKNRQSSDGEPPPDGLARRYAAVISGNSQSAAQTLEPDEQAPGATRSACHNPASRPGRRGRTLLLASLLAAGLQLPALAGADPLVDGFVDPPEGARPRVWWHWMSGNVSKDGITKDLEWMKRVGLAGAMMFDGDTGAAKIVDERVTVLSPQWYDNLRFAASEADRLGLEFTMAAAPGWSETGGPWVQPHMAMKKFVWSETRVAGGKRAGRLAPLPNAVGPFQTIPKRDFTGKAVSGISPFARDAIVLAYPAPAGDLPRDSQRPLVTASDPAVDPGQLVDGDLVASVTLPAPSAGKQTWLRYDYQKPQTLRALTYVGPVGGRFVDPPEAFLEASDDGRTWRLVRSLLAPSHNPAPHRTFAFPAVSARHFRVVFERGETSRNPWPQSPGIALAELAPVPSARADLFEDRAGFGVLMDADAIRTPPVESRAAVDPRSVLYLTDRLRPDGTLDWTPPRGDWIVLRTGYSLTGELNHPATPEGTGLEVDKLDARYVRAHLEAYVTPVIRKLGPLAGRQGLQNLLTDSWEAGQANWTENMVAEFRQRRGYDPVVFLPALAGRVVDSAERTDAFLWDFRRTIADLVADAHYGTIQAFSKEHGLGYYGEATGASWPTVADGLQAKGRVDIPMAEFWEIPFGGVPAAFHGVLSDEFPADVIEARSAAHIYGKPLIAAEAFTSSQEQWLSTPWKLKWVADKYMAMGVNLLAIHTSPHQPSDGHRPGLTLGPFGQTFSRHETWAEMAKPWIDYLARNSFLLQQGLPVADILLFAGEGAPSGVPYREPGTPADSEGYGLDYVNADALIRLARVEKGRITFPGGVDYGLLVLPASLDRMTLPMATKLRDLVAAGAVVMGPKPIGSPSLASDGAAVRLIADQLWKGYPSAEPSSMGKGRVYWSSNLAQVLAAERITRDFEAVSPERLDLRYAHRRLADGEAYFVANQSAKGGTATARFRVTGRVPELWHPESGRVEPAGFRIQGGHTEVTLKLGAFQSMWVVFRRAATATSFEPAPTVVRTLAILPDQWSLHFPSYSGAPSTISTRGGSWTNDPRPEVRFYSGPATYEQVIEWRSNGLEPGARLMLELGEIGDIAVVRVNGRLAGTAWQPSQGVDVTGLLNPGRNQLEIEVANTWRNRLVGDLQPGAIKRAWVNDLSQSPFPPFGPPLTANTPLTPSGLLGRVRLVAVDGPGHPR